MKNLLFIFPELFKGIEGLPLLSNFIVSIFLAVIAAAASFKLKFLSFSGITAAFILTIIVFTLGSWKWLTPIFTFFFSSSFLSKIRVRRNHSVYTFFEKTGQRDYIQVIVNGGFISLLVIVNFFSASELFYFAYVSSLAAVCADTWATEIGTLGANKTYNILNFKEVRQGISGGVSMKGLVGAAFGAIIIPLSSLLWIEINSLIFILLILISGFLASIIDSILGAALQVQYKCVNCSLITEKKIHCGSAANWCKGILWMNNDSINFITGISGGALGYILIDLTIY